MFILQIEHPVPNFEGWKKAFESDPIGRKAAGVQRYRIMRPADNPTHVLIDLEFSSRDMAEAMLNSLRKLWINVEGKVMMNPQTRIMELLESAEL